MKRKDKYQYEKVPRKDKLKLLLVGLAAVVLLAVLILGAKKIQDSLAVESTATQNDAATAQDTITYQGETYTPKKDIQTYVFFGVDEEGPVRKDKRYTGGGQADVQMVLVVDNTAKSWQMLQINRDSMVEVPILGMNGKAAGHDVMQIALAHAYGDGMENSCENAEQAVSDLLGGQEFDGYLALNMDAVRILNDAVGGVTLTVPENFSDIDAELTQGKTVTLTGEQALKLVRARKDVGDGTNLSRMERQRVYLSALGDKLGEVENSTVLSGYDAIFDYMVTNMGSQTVCDLVQMLHDYTEQPLLTLAGTSTMIGDYNAYELDYDSVQKTIFELFYDKI